MKWSHDYKRDVLHPNKTPIELARASMTTENSTTCILNFGVI
jgi:hypothetical protein